MTQDRKDAPLSSLIQLANSNLEPLPAGANFIRAKMLWEIGLDIAGDPTIPYGGDRDVRISVGSGGGAQWRPALNLATGSAILAHDVCAGRVDAAFVNPSALLTQAWRGTGLFERPLPVRVICSYPSWDAFVMAIHPRTGLTSLADLARSRYPLRLSVREDPTHSTLALVEQLFRFHGFSLAAFQAWGGTLVTTGSPLGPKRMEPLADGTIDAIFDEALVAWLGAALAAGFDLMEFGNDTLAAMQAMGWRGRELAPGDYPGLARSYHCLDFSGWPLYCRADLADRHVEAICRAVVARQAQMPWTDGDYKSIAQVFGESAETPLDVPFHPAAERFARSFETG
ncbi:MAG: hypothetical protein IT550_09680 [Novosphingobium sp.]|nr:hypothetical protein [Novosphingobium sp.]